MAVSHWNTGPSAVRYRLRKKNTNTARLQASERASERAKDGGRVGPEFSSRRKVKKG